MLSYMYVVLMSVLKTKAVALINISACIYVSSFYIFIALSSIFGFLVCQDPKSKEYGNEWSGVTSVDKFKF